MRPPIAVHDGVDGCANPSTWRAVSPLPQLWTAPSRRRGDPVRSGSGDDRTAVEAFCVRAAAEMAHLEIRLRTLVAATDRDRELALLEEAVGNSLQIAKLVLDAGRRRRHDTVLALRPLLRALAATSRE